MACSALLPINNVGFARLCGSPENSCGPLPSSLRNPSRYLLRPFTTYSSSLSLFQGHSARHCTSGLPRKHKDSVGNSLLEIFDLYRVAGSSTSGAFPAKPFKNARIVTSVASMVASGVAPPLECVCPPECIDFANILADAAGLIVSKYFRTPVDVEIKLDQSPVTIADKAAETEMRKLIQDKFPTHGVLGEEGGLAGGTGDEEYVWVLDPIDGTASFITGKPLFGTLIALLHNGVPVLGIIDQPILKERWLGVKGQTTRFNGNPIQTRACSSLSNAYLYSTSPHLFSGPTEEAFTRLRHKVRKTNYGCDCYAFGLLSSGFIDIGIEAGVQPWDYLALVPVVEGAGGVMTDWNGKDLRLTSMDRSTWEGEVLAAGDPAAHRAAIEALQWGTSRQ